jgi:hypothetical protein
MSALRFFAESVEKVDTARSHGGTLTVSLEMTGTQKRDAFAELLKGLTGEEVHSVLSTYCPEILAEVKS